MLADTTSRACGEGAANVNKAIRKLPQKSNQAVPSVPIRGRHYEKATRSATLMIIGGIARFWIWVAKGTDTFHNLIRQRTPAATTHTHHMEQSEQPQLRAWSAVAWHGPLYDRQGCMIDNGGKGNARKVHR